MGLKLMQMVKSVAHPISLKSDQNGIEIDGTGNQGIRIVSLKSDQNGIEIVSSPPVPP